MVEPEVLASQSGGGESWDHADPTAWQSGLQAEMGPQRCANWTKGQRISVGGGFMEEVVFALGPQRPGQTLTTGDEGGGHEIPTRSCLGKEHLFMAFHR